MKIKSNKVFSKFLFFGIKKKLKQTQNRKNSAPFHFFSRFGLLFLGVAVGPVALVLVLVELVALVLVFVEGMALAGVVVVSAAGAVRVAVLVGEGAVGVSTVLVALLVDAGVLDLLAVARHVDDDFFRRWESSENDFATDGTQLKGDPFYTQERT